jgi:hypothetical protein
MHIKATKAEEVFGRSEKVVGRSQRDRGGVGINEEGLEADIKAEKGVGGMDMNCGGRRRSKPMHIKATKADEGFGRTEQRE